MECSIEQKKLLEVLRATPAPPVVVFCNTVHTVDQVIDNIFIMTASYNRFVSIQIVNLLRSEQFHVAGLHSEKTQDLRFKIIDYMKKGYIIRGGNAMYCID